MTLFSHKSKENFLREKRMVFQYGPEWEHAVFNKYDRVKKKAEKRLNQWEEKRAGEWTDRCANEGELKARLEDLKKGLDAVTERTKDEFMKKMQDFEADLSGELSCKRAEDADQILPDGYEAPEAEKEEPRFENKKLQWYERQLNAMGWDGVEVRLYPLVESEEANKGADRLKHYPKTLKPRLKELKKALKIMKNKYAHLFKIKKIYVDANGGAEELIKVRNWFGMGLYIHFSKEKAGRKYKTAAQMVEAMKQAIYEYSFEREQQHILSDYGFTMAIVESEYQPWEYIHNFGADTVKRAVDFFVSGNRELAAKMKKYKIGLAMKFDKEADGGVEDGFLVIDCSSRNVQTIQQKILVAVAEEVRRREETVAQVLSNDGGQNKADLKINFPGLLEADWGVAIEKNMEIDLLEDGRMRVRVGKGREEKSFKIEIMLSGDIRVVEDTDGIADFYNMPNVLAERSLSVLRKSDEEVQKIVESKGVMYEEEEDTINGFKELHLKYILASGATYRSLRFPDIFEFKTESRKLIISEPTGRLSAEITMNEEGKLVISGEEFLKIFELKENPDGGYIIDVKPMPTDFKGIAPSDYGEEFHESKY